MKKQILTIVLSVSTILLTTDTYARKSEGTGLSKPTPSNTNSTGGQQKGANCAPATAQLTMTFNDVSAFIEQGGSMWQNRQTNVAAYEVPKGSGLTAIYAGSLWMGGVDVNGQLKLAALTFRNGNDFWPGPLTVNAGSGTYDPSIPVGDDVVRDYGAASIEPDRCLFFDKFYTIRKAEVIKYTQWWECENGITPPEDCNEISVPTADELRRIEEWPAHGDESIGEDKWLAPFYDYDGNGQYEPENGDTPWYDDILGRDDVECGFDRRITLFGDETHWWVFNDKGNIHAESNGDPIGMEVRAQAFSFGTTDEVNRMTFYNYELINRGTQTLYDTYFAQYIDADLGYYNDDFVGCDVSRGLGYVYNGDNNDGVDQGEIGYGENPPAIGCDFFEGPYQDADGRDNVGPYKDTITGLIVTPTVVDAIADTGIVYKGIGVGYSDGIVDNERFGMRLFTYYTNGAVAPYGDPENAPEFYNFMRGKWSNGATMFYGGDGSTGSLESTYMFPGDSDPLNWATKGFTPSFTGWAEYNTDGAGTANQPLDRRFVQSAGPFTLKPGAVNNITVGIVFARGTSGNLSSVDALVRADTKAQALFDACFRILDPPAAPKLTIQELENELILMIDNPATSNNYEEAYAVEDEVNITDPTLDRFYRFEGYLIYQLLDDATGVADISDASKAKIVAQCDVKNGIGEIINFEYDEDLGFDTPVRKVDGSDEGIKHTFRITEDKFASGTKTLVNHKRYYYLAVAYAYNDMAPIATGEPFLYDPTDISTYDGQKIPFISSRLSYDGTAIKAVEAIPHNPIAEAGGTYQNIEYGSTPRITRIDGFGNGNRQLELTDASESTIINSGFMQNPTYEYGYGPINVKVVDPLNVAEGTFELRFTDYTQTFDNAADTASWVIERRVGGVLVETVSSSVTIAQDNEQIIPQWGISVQIKQNNYELPAGGSGFKEMRVADMITASIKFADSSKQWLTTINDNDANYPTNWIRSGIKAPNTDSADPGYECLDAAPDYLNPCNYPDYNTPSNPFDSESKYERLLNGGIAPAKLVGYEASFMPLAYYNSSDNTIKNTYKASASISFMPSVDIVITSDKSKWTRCPVIELGRESALNVGGAQPGTLRKSFSVDKEGNALTSEPMGMGWFPGYAIDLETGARLYMAFGENSFLANDNGADMIWNPSNRIVDGSGNPVMGGMHPVYVFSHNYKSMNNYASGYDFPAYYPWVGEDIANNELFKLYTDIGANNALAKKNTYINMSWVLYPALAVGEQLLSNDVTISMRINKEYKNFTGSGENGGKPMYRWSMDGIATETGSDEALAELLDMINVVPNPYNAFSEYERSRLDNRVKITNLPEVCNVKIYNSQGKLIRSFKKDSPVTSLDWDLKNHKGVPIASGVYIIHVEVPGIGEKVVKFFAAMRQIDLQGI